MSMDEGASGDTQVYDADMLADLGDVFGAERLAQLLAGLDEEIVRRLEPATPDDPALGANAHALVSVSGTLSFTALSQACAALERASLGGADLAGPLWIAQAAGARARRSIAELRAARG